MKMRTKLNRWAVYGSLFQGNFEAYTYTYIYIHIYIYIYIYVYLIYTSIIYPEMVDNSQLL